MRVLAWDIERKNEYETQCCLKCDFIVWLKLRIDAFKKEWNAVIERAAMQKWFIKKSA